MGTTLICKRCIPFPVNVGGGVMATLCPAGFGYKDGQPHAGAVAPSSGTSSPLRFRIPAQFLMSEKCQDARWGPRGQRSCSTVCTILWGRGQQVSPGGRGASGSGGPTSAVARRRAWRGVFGSCRHLGVGGEQLGPRGELERRGGGGGQIRRPLEAVTQACFLLCVCDEELSRALVRVTFIHVILEPSWRGDNLSLFHPCWEWLGVC